MKNLLNKVRIWWLGGCIKNDINSLHKVATTLYQLREAKPELSEVINKALDEELYPAIKSLRNLRRYVENDDLE